MLFKKMENMRLVTIIYFSVINVREDSLLSTSKDSNNKKVIKQQDRKPAHTKKINIKKKLKVRCLF